MAGDPTPWLPRILLGIGVLALLAGVFAIAVGSGGPKPAEIGELGPVQQLYGGIAQEGAELGDPDAEVAISVFTDLRCTACADYQVETIDPLVEELARTGKARFILRHYSLGSEARTLAAAAAVAAGEQGHQWQYAELVLRNLEAAGAEVDEEFLIEIAESLPGLEMEQWDADRASEETDEACRPTRRRAPPWSCSRRAAVLVSGPGGTEELGTSPRPTRSGQRSKVSPASRALVGAGVVSGPIERTTCGSGTAARSRPAPDPKQGVLERELLEAGAQVGEDGGHRQVADGRRPRSARAGRWPGPSRRRTG